MAGPLRSKFRDENFGDEMSIRIELRYGARNFGNKEPAADYKVRVSSPPREDVPVSIDFDFQHPASGRGANFETFGLVYSASLELAADEALAIAQT